MTKSETARGERADILLFELRHSFVIRASPRISHSKTRHSKSMFYAVSSLSPLFFEMKHRRSEPLQYDDRKMLTILFLGDIVGEPGRTAVIARLPKLKEKYALDF